MIEILSNGLQLIVSVGLAIYTGVLASRQKNQQYFVLFCFYITFAMGVFYWLVYLVLKTYTPKYFYVSDLSWVASDIFLLMLCVSFASSEERRYFSPISWIVAAVLAGLTIPQLSHGDYVMTILWNGLLIACAFFATRGLHYALTQVEKAKQTQTLHIAILSYVVVEFGLFLSSCFHDDTIWTNGFYTFFDFTLTLILVVLLIAVRRAVRR